MTNAEWTQTADLSDDSGDALAVCTADLRQYGGRPKVSGRIRTVVCCDDSVVLKKVLDEDGHGCVLVVDGGGSRERAIFGEKTARAAIANGWEGVVIYGVTRDVAALASLPISVKALGTSPRRARQDGAGEAEVPVQFGGVLFRPGGQLWSDEDGIVVSDA